MPPWSCARKAPCAPGPGHPEREWVHAGVLCELECVGVGGVVSVRRLHYDGCARRWRVAVGRRFF